ncbi:MAG: type II secretion system protein GspG [Sedimentisphaerales bacterium]|nr:type II secretion system protein GspG [Sedimentisphaerales bacterium]
MRAKEILTIILVISLTLFYFIAPRFFAGKEVSRTQAALHKMAPIKAAINAFILNTGKLPNRLDDLIDCPEGLENSWAGPYLKESQLHDPWENKYILEYGYRLQNPGADGIKGGDGKNADLESFTGLIKQ